MARKLIQLSRKHYKYHRRIFELEALLCSRMGDPEKAISILEKLKKRSFDIESYGILGGAYKKLWKKTGNALYLHKAQNCYKKHGLRQNRRMWGLTSLLVPSGWVTTICLEVQQLKSSRR